MKINLMAKHKSIVLITVMVGLLIFVPLLLSADENIFDWFTGFDTSVEEVTPLPYPLSISGDWEDVFEYQDANNGIIGFILRNEAGPIGGTYPTTLEDMLGDVNTLGYTLDFVFGDFEWTSTRDEDTQEMVDQVLDHANPNINSAYIGNYADCATSVDYTNYWNNTDRSVRADFYLNSGLNVSMPQTYFFSPYDNHISSSIFGSNICVNIHHALFWGGLEKYSAAKRALPAGHLIIPWIGPRVDVANHVIASADYPQKAEYRAMLQHLRLRGADGYYSLKTSDNPYYTTAEYRDDMYSNAWRPLDWFFRFPDPVDIFNLDTNKTGGIEWSGMRRGNRCQFIFSNFSGSSVQVALPTDIENLPVNSPSVTSGQHLLMDYVIGPLAYWKMDENTGDTVNDEMEGENDGARNSATWTTGKSGSALSFDGNDYVTVPDNNSLDMTDNISISLWFYPTAYDTDYASHLINKHPNSTSSNFAMYLYGATAGSNYKKIRVCATAGGTWKTVSPASYTANLNTWYHVVWTYSSVEGGRLYINGVSQGNPVGSGVLTANTANVLIGAWDYEGKIDEVKIYSGVLTNQEVFDEYHCVLNSRLDEGTGDSVTDDSIYANDGARNNVTWTSGKYGHALSFDGDDYVTVPDNNSLDMTDNISISLWFYPTAYDTDYASHLINKHPNSTNSNFAMYLYGATAGSNYKKIKVCATAGGTWKAVSPASYTVDLNTWYHVIWTYSSVEGGRLYINGVSQGNPVGSGTLSTNTANVYIGAWDYEGKIDEVKIYNKELSTSEVENLVNSY